MTEIQMVSLVVKRPWPTKSTVHVTKLILIEFTYQNVENKKIIIILTLLMTEIEMVSLVVKRPWPTRSTVQVKELILISINLSIQKMLETNEKSSF